MLSNNYCEEEMKMTNETRKILNITDLKLSSTCVRVPVLRAHSESVNIEFDDVIKPSCAFNQLKKAKGVEIIEDYEKNRFHMPNDVMGRDNIAVGRIRTEFDDVIKPSCAINQLKKAKGLEIIEDYEKNRFPMPNDVMGRDNIAVGRIRTDISNPNGLELWLCGDQIRKGAALNAVQIAELLIAKK